MEDKQLNNGLKMPMLGLGVWQSANGKETVDAIHWALDGGYRHIDTARIYKNEEAVGQAISSATLPRQDIWLTTKIWNDDIRQARTTEALEESLRRLGTDYVDLLLLHWPVEGSPRAWNELERALEAGKVRSIGLSNFMEDDIEAIISAGSTVPAVNQIEYHPYLVQAEAISASDAMISPSPPGAPSCRASFSKSRCLPKLAVVTVNPLPSSAALVFAERYHRHPQKRAPENASSRTDNYSISSFPKRIW